MLLMLLPAASLGETTGRVASATKMAAASQRVPSSRNTRRHRLLLRLPLPATEGIILLLQAISNRPHMEELLVSSRTRTSRLDRILHRRRQQHQARITHSRLTLGSRILRHLVHRLRRLPAPLRLRLGTAYQRRRLLLPTRLEARITSTRATNINTKARIMARIKASTRADETAAGISKTEADATLPTTATSALPTTATAAARSRGRSIARRQEANRTTSVLTARHQRPRTRPRRHLLACSLPCRLCFCRLELRRCRQSLSARCLPSHPRASTT